MVLPDDDKYSITRNQLLDQLAYSLGGRAAEELIFHDPSTGASNDIEKATALARAMVTQYGMTEAIGAIKLGTDASEPFMGRDYGHQRDYSENVAAKVDAEIRRILDEQYAIARQLLESNRDKVEAMTAALLEWADKEVVPKAELAWAGKGDFVAGDHCTSCFCKARYTCKARSEQSLAVAQAEFGPIEDAKPPLPQSLSVERIAQLLPKADMVIDWFNDLKAYALEQATKHNNVVPGFKLVEGRSNRKYSNQDDVAAKLKSAGIPEEIMFERSLLGITAMEKAIGKKVFTEVLGDLIVKPEGKPTLVPVSDKRPALTSPASAVEDFL
jgi:hypothetical protein